MQDAHKNKHKFVQKVAKKKILLISFEFSTAYILYIKWGFTRLNKVKKY